MRTPMGLNKHIVNVSNGRDAFFFSTVRAEDALTGTVLFVVTYFMGITVRHEEFIP